MGGVLPPPGHGPQCLSLTRANGLMGGKQACQLPFCAARCAGPGPTPDSTQGGSW